MEKIIILAVLTVFSMVVTGFYFIQKGTNSNKKFAPTSKISTTFPKVSPFSTTSRPIISK